MPLKERKQTKKKRSKKTRKVTRRLHFPRQQTLSQVQGPLGRQVLACQLDEASFATSGAPDTDSDQARDSNLFPSAVPEQLQQEHNPAATMLSAIVVPVLVPQILIPVSQLSFWGKLDHCCQSLSSPDAGTISSWVQSGRATMTT